MLSKKIFKSLNPYATHEYIQLTDYEHFIMLKYIHLYQCYSKCGPQMADVCTFLLVYNDMCIETESV